MELVRIGLLLLAAGWSTRSGIAAYRAAVNMPSGSAWRVSLWWGLISGVVLALVNLSVDAYEGLSGMTEFTLQQPQHLLDSIEPDWTYVVVCIASGLVFGLAHLRSVNYTKRKEQSSQSPSA